MSKPGRPPIYDEPMVIKPVNLPTSYWQYLADEFDGGFAAAIRRLIEQHQEEHKNDYRKHKKP